MRTSLVLLGVFAFLAISVAAFAIPGDFSLTLEQGKNMICLPAVPLNPAPEDVFGTVPINAGQLKRWDAEGKGFQTYYDGNSGFGNMLLGDGYWITAGTPGQEIDYQGLTDTDSMDIWISLPKTGLNLIGNPFSFNYVWENAKVTDGNETVSMYLASRPPRSWLSSIMPYWDAVGKGFLKVGLPDDNQWSEELTPWTGYWLTSKIDKIALILESPL